MIGGSAATASAQLPDESQLPDRPGTGTLPDTSTQQARELPSEATLSPTSPDAPARQENGKAVFTMPTELVLQREAPDSAPDTAAPDTEQTDETPGDQRPILRLNYDGHSSRVNVVRFSDDGNRLVTAGQDKDVHVWQRDPRDRQSWVHRRTIRWQVWRGPRGTINDLTIHANEIAIAGYGAMGGTGEIWIADADSGKWIRSLADYSDAHRMTVDSLAWSKSKSKNAPLVSADLAGRVVRWTVDPTSGKWSHQTILGEDTATYGEATAEALRPFRGFHPVTTLGDSVVTLHFNRMQTNTNPDGGQFTFPIWQVQLSAPENGGPPQKLNDQIPVDVSQFATSDDDTVLAAACRGFGQVRLWRNRGGNINADGETIAVAGRPLFIDLNADGTRLLVGTEAGQTPPAVALYDLTVQPARQMDSMLLNETAASGQIHPSGESVVLAIGSSLRVHSLGREGRFVSPARQVLKTPITPIVRVAASVQSDPLRVAISREKIADGEKPFTEVFNLSKLSLEPAPATEIDPASFLPGQRFDLPVTIRSSKTNLTRFDLYSGETRVGQLPFRTELHGNPTTVSTIKIDEVPCAIVGTDRQNNVYVFSLALDQATQGPSQILKVSRQFRGHSAAVRSTSGTADGRYLITGGDDAMVCVWNLSKVSTASDSQNRWGATFEIMDQKLVIADIDEAGPLYFRGARIGDEVRQLKWPDEAGVVQQVDTADAIMKSLAAVSFDTQVVFDFDRQGRAIDTFQMFPAWYPLATVLIDDQREWAMWTPTGIYNASLAGNQRFGWQLNRGLGEDVEYFRADQFRATLERPDVMRRLLSAGSLAAAMRTTLGGGPPPGETAIVNQIRSRPRIQILSPVPEQPDTPPVVGLEPKLEVVARIESPAGVGIESVKAFIDGIPGSLTSRESIDATTIEVKWNFILPRQVEMELQIYAATTSQSVARETLALRRQVDAPSQAGPAQMHLLAMGVSRYADPNIQSLDFAAKATDAVAESLRSHAGPLYEVTTTQLVDAQATRSLWRICAASTLQELRDRVGPDDLVVMYLCGHGMRDRRTGQWYFVSADADYRDLMNDQFNDCVSLSDLSMFAELPCRKLAILDSCHSGAVQSFMREDDLKSAIRVLQDDVVLTITASEGREEAAEVAEVGLGRFTSRLLEAFAGKADQDRDGEVSLRETIRYVSRTVTEDSRQDGMTQHPTAGPPDLIKRLNLPLTRP